MYKIVVAKQALKDFPRLTSAGLDKKTKVLIELLKENPYNKTTDDCIVNVEIYSFLLA